MDNRGVLIILVVLGFALFLYLQRRKDVFSPEDEKLGEEAARILEDMLDKGIMPPEITNEELEKMADDILMAKVPDDLSPQRENMKYVPTQNTRYWPQYYYSFPYNYKYGGAWPPGMYSRLNYWSPGFYTGTGWSYYMRPGMGYKRWPRNRWIRNTTAGKSTYYYLNNRDDTSHHAASYANLPVVPR